MFNNFTNELRLRRIFQGCQACTWPPQAVWQLGRCTLHPPARWTEMPITGARRACFVPEQVLSAAGSALTHTAESTASAEVAPNETTEDDQNMSAVQRSEDLPGLLLWGCHGAAHSGNVGVVPGVVVHQHRPVCHGGCLIAVVPPAEYFRLLSEICASAWTCSAREGPHTITCMALSWAANTERSAAGAAAYLR